MVIDPRDLVRYVSCKHRALIIDYRNDQRDVIQYANAGQLLVAQVPVDAIVPGLFHWLLHFLSKLFFI